MKALRGVRIGFIGAGTMGQALIKGLLTHGVSPKHVAVAEQNPDTRRRVAQRFHLHVHSQNLHVARDASVIILAVKPQQFPDVVSRLAPHVGRRHLVISIAAGITLRWLKARLPGVPVIRVMPNLPATVAQGFSAITASRDATASHRAQARAIFSAVGEVVELPERYFDAVTAVSGSGPAYLFYLIQAWEDAARNLGLPSTVSAKAIRQTLRGSTRLLEASDEPASTLMARVASKGGTTEAALKVLAKRNVSASFVEALRAAARRSRELSWS